MAEEKDFCTIANSVIESKITEKESEIYEYIDLKTESRNVYDVVNINPDYVEDFKLKSSKCKVTKDFIYLYVQIEFLREFNRKKFLIGNVNSEKVKLPAITGLIGSGIAIGNVTSAGAIYVTILDTEGGYIEGDTFGVFGIYPVR